jgi:hypothetical protein
VEVKERIWCSARRSYRRPLPEPLGVTPRGRSRRRERVRTDFGCEHAFARAAESVREHYGFTLGASAVRTTTLKPARRAPERLEQEYRQPFRVLPARGAEQVIAEADGTMICTVAPGRRKGKRPRDWSEMRWVAAQALGSTTTVYAATFGSVAERRAGGGATARARPAGGSTAGFIRWAMGPIGSGPRVRKSSGGNATFYAISFMSASIGGRRRTFAGPANRRPGAGPSSSACGGEQWPR